MKYGNLLLLPANRRVAFFRSQSNLVRQLRQTEISIVLTQKNAVFRPRGKHTIRLINPLIDQVIDQHANVSLVPSQHERIFTFQFPMCIDSRHQTLRSSFLVTRRSIDLAGEEQPVDNAGFQGIIQILRIEIVVFHRIGGLEDHTVL